MEVYYVYILASASGTLYTGVTKNLVRRIAEHRKRANTGFTGKYDIHRLLYWETFAGKTEAMRREKQIKAWRREKKVQLIDAKNPGWQDLAGEVSGRNTM